MQTVKTKASNRPITPPTNPRPRATMDPGLGEDDFGSAAAKDRDAASNEATNGASAAKKKKLAATSSNESSSSNSPAASAADPNTKDEKKDADNKAGEAEDKAEEEEEEEPFVMITIGKNPIKGTVWKNRTTGDVLKYHCLADGVEYAVGESVYIENQRPDQPYYICQIQVRIFGLCDLLHDAPFLWPARGHWPVRF